VIEAHAPGERGQVAVAAVGAIAIVALVAAGLGTLGRAQLVDARAGHAAERAALAGVRLMLARQADLYPRWDARTRRTLPPRLSLDRYSALARDAARTEAEAAGGELAWARLERGARAQRTAAPGRLVVSVRLVAPGLPAWLGAGRIESLRSARARAGIEAEPVAVDRRAPRAVETAESSGAAAAVVTAALAQLGWPYVWGGESREEGGFDCSGLIDFALERAGLGVGRPTAAGLQAITLPVALASFALTPGDLVFVGFPAHHVGMVVGPGLVIEAPHRGAVVRLEPLASGGWTSAGHIAGLGAAAGRAPELMPAWVPPDWRLPILDAALAENLPPTLLAAQIEVESGFSDSARSPAGALGPAQFMPGTWAGAWNPYRTSSPLERRPALLAQALYMHRLLARAGGDVPRALAAYNAGWSGSEHGWPSETRAYVARIMQRFAGPDALATSPVPGTGGSAVMRFVPRLLPLGRQIG
jgi:cell wall-associated NlpC family hydrolase